MSHSPLTLAYAILYIAQFTNLLFLTSLCVVDGPPVVKSKERLKLQGVLHRGKRPIITARSMSQIIVTLSNSELILDDIEFANGFAQGRALYIDKDAPVSGFAKKHGAHLDLSGKVIINDCIFSGGFSGERYASAVFHLRGADGFMFLNKWHTPIGVATYRNAETVASSVLLRESVKFDIRGNQFYEGMECASRKISCGSNNDMSCCANVVVVDEIRDADQGYEVGQKCCARLLQMDELPENSCCRELLRCTHTDGQTPNEYECMCNEESKCSFIPDLSDSPVINLLGNGYCTAVRADGTWGKRSNRPCQQDQECQVCKESTGLICQRSKPGVDGGCSGKGLSSSYGKVTSTLLASDEQFEYATNDKSFEYETAEIRRKYLESIRI